MTSSEIALKIYRQFITVKKDNGITVSLKAKNVRGTVQDDPFDCWIENEIRKVLPTTFDIYHSGALTTPDLVIRDRRSGTCIGLEIKNLNKIKAEKIQEA